MRKTLIVVTLSLVAATASAQYIPPVRDPGEATRMATEISRALGPLIETAREHAAVANLFAKVQRQLGDDNAGALTAALELIDDYLRTRESNDLPNSKDMLRHIEAVRAKIQTQQLGPPASDLKPLRENIHHEHVHALQKQLLSDAVVYQQLADSFEQIQRTLQGASRLALGAAEHGTSEVKR